MNALRTERSVSPKKRTLTLLFGLGSVICCPAQDIDPWKAPSAAPARYNARIVLDDGSPPPTSVQVLGTCGELKVTGDGAFDYVDSGGIPCTVIVSLRGFMTVHATRPTGALVLHRQGYEGGASMASISAGALGCPAQAGEAYGRGEAALGLGDRVAAEKYLRQATSVCPGHSLAWDELGVILQVSNRIEEARAAYETAVAKDPRSARALTHLAGLAIQESRHAAALELCERAFRLKPMDLPRLWFYYGLEGYRTGQFKAAEERLSRAIKEDRLHLFPLAEFLLGMTMAREGKVASASTHLRAYLALEPGSVEADQARQMLEKTQAPKQ